MEKNYSYTLAEFAANLRYEQIPFEVIERAENLYADWVGSTLAGKGARSIEALRQFVAVTAPETGSAQILSDRSRTTPYFAAFMNAASSHYVEQDDLHSGSVFHPAAVVFPAALAMAQANGSSGQDFLTAAVAGYEVGIRVGEFLGRSHYKIFHTTGTAGTLAAAAAVGNLLKFSPEQMLDAFGSAGTQSAGLWEFLKDAADSKQLHVAKASADGLLSAIIAEKGFKGAKKILEGAFGLAAGMSTDSDPLRLIDQLGSRWAMTETSLKYHASSRHTHPAADALQRVFHQHRIKPEDIHKVVVYVHQAAIDVLGNVGEPATAHQARFSMGTVLALIALKHAAGVAEFEQYYADADVRAFSKKVYMELDEEVHLAYPKKWIGKVNVQLRDGREIFQRVDVPKGEPENTLTREEIEEKFAKLAVFAKGANMQEVQDFFNEVWKTHEREKMELLWVL